MAVIKIAQRGGDCGNLIRYLFGKGRNNEHVNQRTITGTTHAHSGAWDKQSIHQIVSDLRAFSQANPQSRIGQENKHIWHAAISLPPGETLTDQGWHKLAQDYMRGMGFDDPSKAPIRWTAIHHGTSRDGNDHVHIVMSMIRQDGTKVRIHDDAKHSRTVLTGIEHRLGLTVLKPPPNGARPITYKAGERGKAEKTGNPIEREDLARRVRAAATVSKTEAEFVRRLRKQGITLRPRSDDTGRVIGYSAGFPNSILFGGGKLARDLSLPRLRTAWSENAHGLEQAATEWRLGKNDAPRVRYGRETRKNIPLPGDVKRELADAHLRLATSSAEDFPAISADLAGALSLASAHDPRLQALSTEVGRAAQTTGAPRRRSGGAFLNLGLLVMAINDPDPRTREMLMIRQVVAMLVTLVQTHRARAAAITNQKGGTGMSQPDASDEVIEMGVTTGVTLGAAAVQMALQRLHGGRGPKNPPKQQPPPPAVKEKPKTAPAPAPTRSELISSANAKLEALGIEGKFGDRLDQLDNSELVALVGRLDETMQHTPGAVDKERLLAYYRSQQDAVGVQRVLDANGEQVQDMVRSGQLPALQKPTVQEAPSVIPNWRTGGEPMTPAQRFTLKNLCAAHGMDPNKDLVIDVGNGTTVAFQDFTKAQASGAISEFSRMEQGKVPVASTGVGVGNSNVRSGVAQQVILTIPTTTPPAQNVNQGRSNSKF